MGEYDWLERYTLPGGGWDYSERVHCGAGRRVVTDARCILAVDDPTATFHELVLSQSRGVVTEVTRRLLAEPVPPEAMRTDVADLWLWLDCLVMARCPACGGSGCWGGLEWNDPPPCEDCGGRGWVFPWPDDDDWDTVTVAGAAVAGQRLAWWLAGELESYGTNVSVWQSAAARLAVDPSGYLDAVTFDGGGWRLVCSVLKGREGKLDSYRTYYPGAGVWWAARRDPVARLAAADWFHERGGAATPATLFGGAA